MKPYFPPLAGSTATRYALLEAGKDAGVPLGDPAAKRARAEGRSTAGAARCGEAPAPHRKLKEIRRLAATLKRPNVARALAVDLPPSRASETEKKMFRTAIAAFALCLAAGPAFAADFSGAKAVCADAIAVKEGKSLDGARTKLVKARDGAVLRVTVKVDYPDGADATGECRIRRGEIQSVELAS